jgi:hypothetical protein
MHSFTPLLPNWPALHIKQRSGNQKFPGSSHSLVGYLCGLASREMLRILIFSSPRYPVLKPFLAH